MAHLGLGPLRPFRRAANSKPLGAAALVASVLLISLALPHLSASRGDGQIEATNISEQRVEILPAERIPLGGSSAAKLAVASSGRIAVIAEPDRSQLRIIDLGAPGAENTLTLPFPPSAVALDDSSDTALVGYAGVSGLDVVELRKLSINRTISLPAPPGRLLAASTLQKAVVTLPAQNALGVIDLKSSNVSQIYVGREPSGLALDSTTLSLLVTSREDNSLTIVDLTSLSVVATLPTGPLPSDVAVDSGTGVAYVACSGSGLIERFDIAQHVALGALDDEPITGLARLAIFPESAFGTVRCLLVASSALENSLAIFNLVKDSRWRVQSEEISSDLAVSSVTGRLVTLGAGTGLLSLDVRPISPPVISAVEPLTPGSVKKNGVIISGHNFLARSAQGLRSGTVPDPEFAILVSGAPSSEGTLLDDSTAHVFSGAELRRVPFQIQTPNGSSNIAYLKDPDLVPLLSSISPASGPESGGTRCTINGEGFLDGSPGTTSVTFGATPAANVVVVDDNTIVCTSPPGTDSVEVKISNSQGSSAGRGFVYLPPDLSINDVSVTEGNAGTVNAVFTVTLGAVSATPVTVDYATSDRTATAGTDYVAKSGSLTFAPGTTSQSITIVVNGDTDTEPTESFVVDLSNPVDATIRDGQGRGTITNDDGLEYLSIGYASVTEGNTGTVNAVFNVTLSAASATTVTVDYATTDATATAGSDYVAQSGTLTFAPGTTSQSVTVVVNGDTDTEPGEYFYVNLSNPSNATIYSNQGQGTITNDDGTEYFYIGSATVTEGQTGTVSAVFTVTLSSASATTTNVDYATIDGTALASSDYVSTSGTLTFAPGTTSQTITVTVNGDTVEEPTEKFFVNLSNPVNAAIYSYYNQGTGTITNDDGLQYFSIGSATVTEGNSGTVNAVFTVTLSAASATTTTVDYATTDGMATAGSDYVAKSGTLTFTPGTTSQTITVTVNGDTVEEPTEQFFVNLSNPVNATIYSYYNQGTGTITNDDGLEYFSIGNATVTEGNSGTVNAVFTVTLSAASATTTTVDYATSDGTATAGSDYVAKSGTLTFTPGTTSQSITFIVSGDTVTEPTERFFVNLSNPVKATLYSYYSQGTGTITNDDGLEYFSIGNATVTEGNSGTVNAVFTVTLSAASATTTTIDYATTDGTAAAGSDYVAKSGTLTFAPGTTSQSITVIVNGDTVTEPAERFYVNLSNPVSATIYTNQGTGTITNDDGLEYFSIGNATVTEGNSGTVNAVFTVTLSAASATRTTVDFATTDGTAAAGSDYAAASGTLTFTPGITSQTITVVVNGDTVTEPNERFFVNLSNPVSATVYTNQGTGTINNDDGLQYFTIGTSVTVTEGNSGAVSAVFNVTLSAVSATTTTVDYGTADGTATAGSDYVATTGTLTFSPGTTTQTITVAVNGDSAAEANEQFYVNLSNPGGATLSTSHATGNINDDDSLLSIGDALLVEGDSGTLNAVFTVTLSPTNANTVTVDFSTVDGTATAPGDYTFTSGNLTFSPYSATRTITVPVVGDSSVEGTESFLVDLSGATGAGISTGRGTATIIDNDGSSALSISDVIVTEGNSGTRNAVFTVTLTPPSASTVTVDYATANGTAAAPGDYIAKTGTLTFAPGILTQTLTISVNGDGLDEPNEIFNVSLSNPTNATIAVGTGKGTITDDDIPAYFYLNNATVTEGDTGTKTATFTITLAGGTDYTVTVNYSTSDGTAAASSDYVAASGVLTFAPGITAQTVTVTVNGDTLTEPNEVFYLNLSNPTNATLYESQSQCTISNDDGSDTLSVGSRTVTEGDTGTTNAVFTVTLSPASAATVTVQYATSDGTAAAGSDYVATSGTLTFAPGTTSQSITVVVNGDTLTENNETFYVNIFNPTNATLSSYANQGTGTITNDDGLETLSVGNRTVTEGHTGTVNAVFNVTLSAASATTVTVQYATSDGTATAGSDYVAASGTLTFAPGTTSQSVTVVVNGDTLTENNETFYVNIFNPTNATLYYYYSNQGTGTITNDDGLEYLYINNRSVTEGHTGTVNAVFTVTLSAASATTVTVQYATADGTAVAGSDYVATSGTLTFAPGTTTQSVTVVVNGDTLTEKNENFFVNLFNPTNATLYYYSTQGTGTINNDDGLEYVYVNSRSMTEGHTGTTDVVFTVTLSAASATTVTVQYATSDGTAKAGSDYVATSGTLTFAPGTTTQSVTVAVNGDTLTENNEIFYVNLFNPTNATLYYYSNQGIGTVTNDDGLEYVYAGSPYVTEGHTGTVNAVFTVTLSAASATTVTVQYATSDGTAAAGSDYVATSGTLTFAPGTTTQSVTVAVNGDTLTEKNENFYLNLFNPTNATLYYYSNQGIGTIYNDDGTEYLYINNPYLTEGDTGSLNAVFNVTLSSASAATVTVQYATLNGTALAGSDYVAASGTLTFSPGTTTQTVSVAVNGDTIKESNEDFFVNLSNPTNATFYYSSQGRATIYDNDNSGLSINDVSVTEGNSGTVNAVFTVTLFPASNSSTTVNYATSNYTASSPSDFLAASGSLTFAPGVTTQTITVAVNGDTLLEGNEVFYVYLSSAEGASLVDGTGIGTILTDDSPSLAINDVSVTEGNSSTRNAVFTVTLSPSTASTVTVNYATADGTATAPGDYAANSGTLTFAPGITTQTVSVVVNGDTVVEPDETFVINLSSGVNATITDNQGIGTILNDDGIPTLSINDVTVTEGNSGTVNALFTVTLSAASASTVTVDYATADSTAAAPLDYAAASGTLSFAPGTLTQTVTVVVNGDLTDELNETFVVNLTAPTNATLLRSQGTGTITNDDLTTNLSITDVNEVEGNAGATNAVFTVNLSSASSSTVTVNYATADATATAGVDYIAASGTLTFAPGTLAQTVTVAINGDTLVEPDETFVVNLSGAVNATIADNQGSGTILNDDNPGMSIGDVQVTESNSGTVSAFFTVTLSVASLNTVTVNYATADGTATAPGDYAATSGLLTFPPGALTQTILVPVNGDILVEPDETFFVNLSGATNASITDGQGLGTILNDDNPSLSIGDAVVTEGNTGTVGAVFTVTLSPLSSNTVTVNYATANGTATDPVDYAATSGTLTFPPGTSTQTITVAVNGDSLVEGNETFRIDLSGAVNAAFSDSQAVGTITDDDATLSISDASVTEGNGGTINANFTVTLSPASSQTVTVNYATADGTASAPGDYLAGSGTLTFAPGVTTRTITIMVNGDTLVEGNETFLVNLSGPTNGSISDAQGVGTIVNDDTPFLSISDATVTEGNAGTVSAVFDVTLSTPSVQAVTVAYDTANGTASAGTDYLAASGTLTFAPGTTVQNIVVFVNGDTAGESDETFTVNLSSPLGAAISDGQGVGTIINDDAAPRLSINDISVVEGNSGTVSAVFAVTLSTSSTQTVTVNYGSANGSATAGSDYITASGTLTFAPGSTAQSVTVIVSGDLINEPDETFFVNLSGVVNATIADAQGMGTITNDDAAPRLSITDASAVEGNAGSVNAAFSVTLSSPAVTTVTVNFATSDGSALAGNDYVATSGTLTFAPGSTSQPVTVAILGDVLGEGNETFSVNLGGSVNAEIADGLGIGTIIDDDAGGTVQFTSASASIGEGAGSAIITITRTGGDAAGAAVDYSTSDGSATAGLDYSASSGTVVFGAGETIQTFTIPILDDTLFEGNETVNLILSNPRGGASLGAPSVAVLTVAENDPAPGGTFQFNVTAYRVNENAGSAVITVTRTGVGLGAASVNYATSNGTASAGADYTAASGTLSFAAGETSQTFTVAIIDDALVEGNETVNLALNGPTGGATLRVPPTAILNIIDNDNPVPIISGLTPSFGEPAGGTFVRISGRYFVAGAAVRFGGALATDVQVLGENAITCASPAGTGTVDVSVTTLQGTGTLVRAFTYIAAPPAGTQLDWFAPDTPGSASEEVSAAPGDGLPPPRDLKATRVTVESFDATNPRAAGARLGLEGGPRLLSYNIYRSTDPNFIVSDESARLIANVPAGVTSYLDPDFAAMAGELKVEPTYFYRVTALYERGESVQTNPATTGIAITRASLETVNGELTLVLEGVSFATFRAQIQVDGVRLRQIRFPENARLGNGTSSRIEGVDNLDALIPRGQSVRIVVVNPGEKEDLSDAQYSEPFVFRRGS